MPNYSKGQYSVSVSTEGYIKVKSGDCLSAYSWAIYGNYTTLDVFKRLDSSSKPINIANKDLIIAGETLVHMPDYKPGGNGGGSTRPGGPKVGMPPTTSKPGVSIPKAETTPANVPATQNVPGPCPGAKGDPFLKTLKLATDSQGYFKVVANYVCQPAQRLFLTVGNQYDAIDITGGFSASHHRQLLDLLFRRKYTASAVARTAGCRALVVEPASSMSEDLNTRFTVYQPGGGSYGDTRMVVEISNELTLPLPVEPIPLAVGRGFWAAHRIGMSMPFIPYKEREGGLFLGRYLSPAIDNRHWFLFGNKLETNPTKRAIDCTTFVMSCYQNAQAAPTADAACNNVGAGVATAKLNEAAMKQYLKDHPGAYFIIKYNTQGSVNSSHVMLYEDGFVREFTAANPDAVQPGEGYRSRHIDERPFQAGAYYTLRSMP
jgi:hypothetical protein